MWVTTFGIQNSQADVAKKWNAGLAQLTQAIAEAAPASDSKDDIREASTNKINNSLAQLFGENGFPTSDSTLGKFILNLKDRNSRSAVATLAYFLDVLKLDDASSLSGATHGVLYEMGPR